ncbi:MAG: hypothetical protein LBR40_02135, partial [Bacilli bacterium]|nr:hypothetical protein [Bacilli bacterium]
PVLEKFSLKNVSSITKNNLVKNNKYAVCFEDNNLKYRIDYQEKKEILYPIYLSMSSLIKDKDKLFDNVNLYLEKNNISKLTTKEINLLKNKEIITKGFVEIHLEIDNNNLEAIIYHQPVNDNK